MCRDEGGCFSFVGADGRRSLAGLGLVWKMDRGGQAIKGMENHLGILVNRQVKKRNKRRTTHDGLVSLYWFCWVSE